ncbi:MAG TPA: hypothetical protein VJB65_04385 [Patescibacteria group bacterium]|nr:hypothetical protein [Patescibacteria group bacterium]
MNVQNQPSAQPAQKNDQLDMNVSFPDPAIQELQEETQQINEDISAFKENQQAKKAEQDQHIIEDLKKQINESH